jgi:hypothetical protein
MIQQLKEILSSEGWSPSVDELTYVRDGETVKICPKIMVQNQDRVGEIIDEGGLLLTFADGSKEFLEFKALVSTNLPKRYLSNRNSTFSPDKWARLIENSIKSIYFADT